MPGAKQVLMGFAGLLGLFSFIWFVLSLTNVLCTKEVGLCYKQAQPMGADGACPVCPAAPAAPVAPSPRAVLGPGASGYEPEPFAG